MNKLLTFLGSTRFLYMWLSLFSIGALWIALSSLYPMAFDEEFHYGLIQIYSEHLLPHGIKQTSDMAQYGAAAADTSYLFHYLMSFPYRLLAMLNLNDQVIISILRSINIIMMVTGLIIFRQALRVMSVGKLQANFVIVLFSLIPIVPMLAGQINYDNLLMVVMAYAMYSAAHIWQRLKTDDKLSLHYTWKFVITVLFGVAVKYAFLPIALGAFAWLVAAIWWVHRARTTVTLKNFLHSSFHAPTRLRIFLVIALTAGIFFAARYPINYIQYGAFIPSCDQVFDDQACTAFGPWNRNRNLVAVKPDTFEPISLPAYLFTKWLPGMTERLTFAVAGKTNGFQTKKPLPLVLNIFVVLAVTGAALLAYQLFRSRGNVPMFIWLTLGLVFIYCGVLVVRLYSSYVLTAQPVAINGRYLLPLLPLVGASLIWAASKTIKELKLSARLLPIFGVLVVALLIVAGAGISTYIIQSEAYWFWSNWQGTHAFLQAIVSTLVYRG